MEGQACSVQPGSRLDLKREAGGSCSEQKSDVFEDVQGFAMPGATAWRTEWPVIGAGCAWQENQPQECHPGNR